MTQIEQTAEGPDITGGADAVAPVRLGVIVGSIRQERFCPTPARWIAGEASRRDDLDVDLIDLADAEFPAVLNGNDPEAPIPPQLQQLGERLDRADGFVVVTPVYNRSYPAVLKNAIDWFYTEWMLKAVGFVSYGGITGGLTSVEHLRGVFAEFNAVTLRDTIMFANFWDEFDHDGRPNDAARKSERAGRFLDQLVWWARALREARERRPYPAGNQE